MLRISIVSVKEETKRKIETNISNDEQKENGAVQLSRCTQLLSGLLLILQLVKSIKELNAFRLTVALWVFVDYAFELRSFKYATDVLQKEIIKTAE